jgi:pyrroline-5-carboxylate reductase
MRFGVIGYGKMGSSLVRGALGSGLLKPRDVRVMDLDEERREAARREGLTPVGGLKDLAGSDAILLSVKPKDFPKLLKQIVIAIDPKGPLFISIAAGLMLSSLEEGLGVQARVARVMPNLPASVNEAASVYIMNRRAIEKDRDFMKRLLAGVGKAYELDDEGLLNAVTGLSGNGPAYFFLMMGAMESAGIRAGLPKDLVRSLVAQTCRGSGTLALSSDQSLEELVKAVASPGGATEEALRVLESKGFSSAIAESIVAAIEKLKKMARV